MVPAAFTLRPPEKLPALLIAPAELKLMTLVPATVPTAPCKLRDPVVAPRLILVPVMVTAGLLIRLPFATMLNTLPAPELPVTVVLAFESVR